MSIGRENYERSIIPIFSHRSRFLRGTTGSARPAPLIGSLSPSTLSFAQVQQSTVLIVNGSHFVSSSEVVINGKTISTTVISDQQLRATITTGLISGPGAVNVSVHTPSGNPGNLGCTSGGNSSVLVLTIT